MSVTRVTLCTSDGVPVVAAVPRFGIVGWSPTRVFRDSGHLDQLRGRLPAPGQERDAPFVLLVSSIVHVPIVLGGGLSHEGQISEDTALVIVRM